MSPRLVRIAMAFACALLGDVAAAKTRGVASWYGRWHEGHPMANGKPFHALELSAASRTLPLGSWISVLNLANGLSVRVPVLDRGPYVQGRILDLSQGAAMRLGMIAPGLAVVEIDVIAPPQRR